MKRAAVICVALVSLGDAASCRSGIAGVHTRPISSARGPSRSVERGVSGEKPERIQNARGLLIFDSAGHAFELFTTASRQQPETPQADPLGMFNAYGGFWGGYRVDAARKRITFKAQGAISLAAQGREFSRSFDQTGDRLTMTSIDEPHAQGGTRWTWQRVPTIDHLSPFYRQAVGFWEHVVERRVNVSTGAVVSESRRAPSVIVYTPGGFVGVHFPAVEQKAVRLRQPDGGRSARGTPGIYRVLRCAHRVSGRGLPQHPRRRQPRRGNHPAAIRGHQGRRAHGETDTGRESAGADPDHRDPAPSQRRRRDAAQASSSSKVKERFEVSELPTYFPTLTFTFYL